MSPCFGGSPRLPRLEGCSLTHSKQQLPYYGMTGVVSGLILSCIWLYSTEYVDDYQGLSQLLDLRFGSQPCKEGEMQTWDHRGLDSHLHSTLNRTQLGYPLASLISRGTCHASLPELCAGKEEPSLLLSFLQSSDSRTCDPSLALSSSKPCCLPNMNWLQKGFYFISVKMLPNISKSRKESPKNFSFQQWKEKIFKTDLSVIAGMSSLNSLSQGSKSPGLCWPTSAGNIQHPGPDREPRDSAQGQKCSILKHLYEMSGAPPFQWWLPVHYKELGLSFPLEEGQSWTHFTSRG